MSSTDATPSPETDVRSVLLGHVQHHLTTRRAEAARRRFTLLCVARFYARLTEELAPLNGFHGLKVKSPRVWHVPEEPTRNTVVDSGIHLYVAEYTTICPFECTVEARHGVVDADGVCVFEVKVLSGPNMAFRASISVLEAEDEAKLLKLARDTVFAMSRLAAPHLLDKFKLVNGKPEPVS